LSRISLSRIPTFSGAISKIFQLLEDIRGRQAGGAGIIGTTLTVGVMAEAASRHVWFPAVGHGFRHLRMITGEPVSGAIIVVNLLQIERIGSGGQVP
jgi:hypothetical protein